jgi:hypothetical protein
MRSLEHILDCLICPDPSEMATGCWVWPGYVSNGYGRARCDGKVGQVHRIVYERLVEPIPPGLCLDHLCRNRLCCNPDHLEPVTLGENVLRGEGRSAVNARKTHCMRGHPLEGANLYVWTNGSRRCIACLRDRTRYYRSLKKPGQLLAGADSK